MGDGPGPPGWTGPGRGPGWPGATGLARRLFALLALFFALPIAIGVVIAAGFAGWTGAAVAVVIIVALLALGALLLRFAVRTLRSVNDLVSSTGRLSDGDYTVRMAPSPSAAFRPATEAFNRMAERLAQSDDLRRRLLADVGHELRTPLTIMRGELEAIADGVREVDDDGIRRLLGDVAAMERLLEDLATLSTTEAGVLRLHRETVDVVALVDEVVERFRNDAGGRGVTLSVSPRPGSSSMVEAEVDPHRVGEVVSNLMANALRAVSDGGRVDVRVARGRLDEQPAAVVEVHDDGPGIPNGQLEAVFDRFQKGAESGGSGLGLTISRDLTEAHGGTLVAASEVGSGTTMTVRLPLAPGTID